MFTLRVEPLYGGNKDITAVFNPFDDDDGIGLMHPKDVLEIIEQAAELYQVWIALEKILDAETE